MGSVVGTVNAKIHLFYGKFLYFFYAKKNALPNHQQSENQT
jgi:hypothetical protein